MIDPEQRLVHAPLPLRPRLTWPGGARIAVWVCPNIEHYEFMPAQQGSPRDPWPRTPHPDILGYGTRDYGNRVGFWRMADMMDRLGIRCTVSLGVAAFEHYPAVMKACLDRGWDVMCHGIYNTQYLWDMPEAQERAFIAECVESYSRVTGGGTMAGWLSPALSYTLNTPDLVAEAGFKYFCDVVHDEQPWPIRTRGGQTMISLPYTVDLNDAVTNRAGLEAPDFCRMVRESFTRLHADGATQGRVMCIAIHPYNMAQPHRARHLEETLAWIMGHEGVWQATGAEIADWYLANHHPKIMAALGDR
jgi:peptidoglycan/xylan/chitin deacetylase (PgdA/CDA1 family)